MFMNPFRMGITIKRMFDFGNKMKRKKSKENKKKGKIVGEKN